MGLIEKGEYRSNLKYPFFLFIFLFTRNILIEKIDFSKEGGTFCMLLGELLTGIIVKLHKECFIKNFVEKIVNKSYSTKTTFILKTNHSKKFFFNLLLLIFCSIIDISIFFLKLNIGSLFISFESKKYFATLLIFNSILCKFFLKIPIYNHHLFCIIIMSINTILIPIIEIIFDQYELKKIILYFFLNIAISFAYSVQSTCEKYLLDIAFVEESFILFFEGMFGIFILFIYLFFKNNSFKITIVDKFNYVNLIKIIFYIILSGGYNLYRLLIFKFYSPMHRTCVDSLIIVILVFYYKHWEEGFLFFILSLIIYLIFLFISLVYIEVIILHFYNLHYNTYKYITLRENGNKNLDNINIPLENY